VDEPIISPAASVTFPESSTAPLTAKASTKSKKRKTQVPSQIPAKPTASSTSAKSDSHSQQLQKSTASLASYATESDGEWTRVSRRADKIRTSSTTEGLSDIGQTTTSATTGTSSPIDTRTEEGEEEEEEEDAIVSGPGERHPLAKKLLPKPRKTGVEEYVRLIAVLSSSTAFLLFDIPILSLSINLLVSISMTQMIYHSCRMRTRSAPIETFC
jgi:hypothetical protein